MRLRAIVAPALAAAIVIFSMATPSFAAKKTTSGGKGGSTSGGTSGGGTTSGGTSGGTSTQTFTLGMNMSRCTYYSADWAFADAFKHAGGWSPRGTTYPQLYLDANGWPLLQPGQMAQVPIFQNIGGHYPAGSWKLTYDGDGSFIFYYDCVKTSEAPGVVTFNATPSNLGMLIQLASSSSTNPVRNIRLYFPDVQAMTTKPTFHPTFMSTVRPFAAIRFMEWQFINYAYPTSWSQRTKQTDALQTGQWGVALEYMIQLCNEANIDPWFCMPHTADDNYVTQFATIVRDTLRSDRKVYVEWSNEAWNYGYQQGIWCCNQATALGLSYPQVMGDNARHVFGIWSQVFAGQTNRMVRVAAGQHYNPWVLQTMLPRLNGEFDAISCGGYFFPSDADISTFNSTTTPQQILDACSREMDRTYFANLAAHQTLAQQYAAQLGRPIPLLVYEGGQHLAPNSSSSWFAADQAAQTDPMMGTLYDKMLTGIQASNVDVKLFMAYHLVEPPSQYGSFGHLKYQDEPWTNEPKFNTLMKYTTRR